MHLRTRRIPAGRIAPTSPVFVAHRVPGSPSCNRNAGNSSPKTLLIVLEADEEAPSLYSSGKKDSQASRRS